MSMFEVSRVSVEIGGDEISFETGKLAKQASGAVVVRAGDTMVLNTATIGSLRDVDFLPLTVAMIDRPIRPLFPKGWHYETQIVATPMSVDYVRPYDILAMNGASAAYI